MGKDKLTRSIDVFSIEVSTGNDGDYIDISRQGIHGTYPGIAFKKGDTPVAVGFMAQIAELLGVELIVKKGKK